MHGGDDRPSKSRVASGFHLVDGALVEALSNPYRSNALGMCSLRPTSAKDVSRELGISRPLAHHHLKRLLALGCIEPVPNTGDGDESGTTLYRATVRHFLDVEDFASISPERRMKISLGILRMISDDISRSVQSELIVKHDDDHLSRTPMRLDDQGWDEVVAILRRTSEELWEVRGDAAERLARSDVTPRHVSVAIIQCEVPPPHQG